ncbi:MAG: hypothetical protein HY066_06660 [Betaproteobacteria bacterium]|nr:hypothetical protein [Betaproteobacteria bacterium]
MNPRPIDEARNADLRGSFQALQRAAQRAREVAARTGTALVFSLNGVVEYRQSDPVRQQPQAASPKIPVSDRIDDVDLTEHFQRKDVKWGLKGDD